MKHLKTIFIVTICIIAVIGKNESKNYSSAVGKKAMQKGCVEIVNQFINQ